MPYGRYSKYQPRKFRTRKGRKYPKRKSFSRFGTRKMGKNGMIYRFKRSGSQLTEYTLSTPYSDIRELGLTGGSCYNFSCSLQFVPDFQEFTNLYDQYKIKAIKVSFIPVCNFSTFQGITGMTNTNPPFQPGQYAVRSYSALDFNFDTTGIQKVDDIREYQNMKWKPYPRIHTRYFYPRINNVDTEGGYTYKEQPWLNTGDAGVTEHYGLKFAVDQTTAPTGTILYRIETKYYLAFRVPK